VNTQLKEAIKHEDTILFVGSGISCWSGLPSWPKLLSDLAGFLEQSDRDPGLVRKEIGNDLLQAASYGFDQLTPSEIGAFIRKALHVGTAFPHEIHRKIVSLGPRCYVTTNYDQLLEESLRKWHVGRSFQIVTNKLPFEEADIIRSRTLDFVFKPHGDVGDVESIILTREQYRQLFDNGEYGHALESLKTLLVTRRVIYLGFSLRDPDFLLLRDVIANTWKGGARDHHAVLADVGAGEIAYWRKNYGIHLTPYATTTLPDGRRDHSALLSLLDECLQPMTSTEAAKSVEGISADVTLSILRYASGLMRAENATPALPLRVHAAKVPSYGRVARMRFDHWDHTLLSAFLEEGPKRALLLGLPGAGKSYGITQAVARLARALHDACLLEQPRSERLTVPLFADMKLYEGDVAALLERSLPSGIALQEIKTRFRVRVFLDSFNEMPRDHWGRGTYVKDVARFLSLEPQLEMIISSRTDDGLATLDLPTYWLDELDPVFLEERLQELKLTVGGRFGDDVRRLLRKPLYFHLVTTGSVTLPPQPHPKDLYESLLSNISDTFARRFGHPLSLHRALAPFAYEAVNRGEEVLDVQILYQSFEKEMQSMDFVEATAEAAVHWLVSKGVLVPYPAERVSFFHQSVTEFLAATELARRFRASPSVLSEKLALNRWDQAILLTLSMLDEKESPAFLDALLNTDFTLTLRATKYLEGDRDAVVARLLQEIAKRARDRGEISFEIALALERDVPVTAAQEAHLRSLIGLGNLVGGIAAKLLIRAKGDSVKAELLASLVERRADFNYCAHLGQGLEPLMTPEDLKTVMTMVESIGHEMGKEEAESFGWGLSEALAALDVNTIAKAFLEGDNSQAWRKDRVDILMQCMWRRNSTDALALLADLLLKGVARSTVAIYLVGSVGRGDKLSWDFFDQRHVATLIDLLERPDEEAWALQSLRRLCSSRPDLAARVAERARLAKGLRRAALFNALGPSEHGFVFAELEAFAAMPALERLQEPQHLIEQMKVDWYGHEELFVRLLRLRDGRLANRLLESVGSGLDPTIGYLQIGDIAWWLEWLSDDSEEPAVRWRLQDRLSALFAERLNAEDYKRFVAEFNRKDTRYRELLAHSILKPKGDLTTDDFSEDALTFLLNDLHESQPYAVMGLLLGNTATETFVTERLLPMLQGAQGTLRSNLLNVLNEAGKRHGRRYIAT